MRVVWTFFLSSFTSIFFLPLWETARYRLKYCLKRPLSPKQPTNQPLYKKRTLQSELIELLLFVQKELCFCATQCGKRSHEIGWLVGCFGFTGTFRQYFSPYRAVSERGRKRREKIEEIKNVQTPPPASTASAVGPCPTIIQLVGRNFLCFT